MKIKGREREIRVKEKVHIERLSIGKNFLTLFLLLLLNLTHDDRKERNASVANRMNSTADLQTNCSSQ